MTTASTTTPDTAREEAIDLAWNQYKDWAADARASQAATRSWNVVALLLAVLTAVLGALTSYFSGDSEVSTSMGVLAAITSGIATYLGRNIFAERNEERWIEARRVAEAIKSEVFRYAGDSGVYSPAALAGQSAEHVLAARIGKQSDGKQAPLRHTARSDQKTCPPFPMSREWYEQHRIQDQLDYYAKGQSRHASSIRRIEGVAAIGAISTIVLGALASRSPAYAPLVAAATTAVAAIVAFGLLERRKAIATSYGAMCSALAWTKNIGRNLSLDALVAQIEDLLATEHGTWAVHMKQKTDQSTGGAQRTEVAPQDTPLPNPPAGNP